MTPRSRHQAAVLRLWNHGCFSASLTPVAGAEATGRQAPVAPTGHVAGARHEGPPGTRAAGASARCIFSRPAPAVQDTRTGRGCWASERTVGRGGKIPKSRTAAKPEKSRAAVTAEFLFNLQAVRAKESWRRCLLYKMILKIYQDKLCIIVTLGKK